VWDNTMFCFYDRCKMAVNYNFEMKNNEKWIKLKGCVA
jgi:hypothetical protein